MSEFQNLPSGWKVVRLGDVFEKITIKNRPDEPILTIKQGVGTILRENSDRQILFDKKRISTYKFVKKNDFIIHLRSFEGGFEMSNHQGIVSPAYIILRNKILISHLYFKNFFRSYLFIHKILAICVEGIRDGKQLNFDTVKNLKIPFPPVDEQEKIAEILSTWDEAINLTINLVESKKQFKKALMQNLLTAKIRFHRFKDEWKKIKMNDIFTEIDERSIANNQYEILSVTLNGIVPQNIHFKKRIASKDNSGYKILRYGNLVIGMNLWMGGIDILTNQNIGIVSPAYRIFKIDDKYNIYFLRNFIKTKKMLELYVLHSEQGASVVRRNLNLSELLEEKIKLPNLKEQQKIAEVLTACNDEINLLILKLENLKKQKQGLMQKLLSGKVRVK